MKATRALGLALLICGMLHSPGLAADQAGEREAGLRSATDSTGSVATMAAPAVGEHIKWQVCAPAGGNAASPSCRMNGTVAQAAVGLTSSSSARLRSGFWQQFKSSCALALTGDVNVNGTVTSSDIIYLVNHVFKGGAAPLPCAAAGDVNCSGNLTSADIIGLVNFVFKGGAAPCDGCTSPLATGC